MASQQTDELIAVSALRCEPPVVEHAQIHLTYSALSGDEVAYSFTEVIELPAPIDHVDAHVRDTLLHLLSLAASPSYFKAFAPPVIEVPAGLTDAQRTFLGELITKGLGEFMFVNDLPRVFDTEIVAPVRPELSAPNDVPTEPRASTPIRRVLVAVGGGKDSVVSIEALKSAGYDVELCATNGFGPIDATARVAGLPLHGIRRRLDPLLFELNAAGAHNGHVPITAVNSLVTVLSALALGFDAAVFSNEASSSFGNVGWHGHTINHQWSKGLDFERMLGANLPDGSPAYFSLLRPLTELRIARRFATHREYHPVFTSCNRAYRWHAERSSTWCGECPKCRFVFLCLAPFLPKAELLAIFGGRDLFADPAQRDGFLDLLGAEERMKPFECVGEPDECRVALALLREHADWAGHAFFADAEVAAVGTTAAEREAVFAFHDAHLLTPEFEAVARAV
ncbi:MAG TPA: hypothetical protein VFU07_01650 [Candidatus Lumbricidophila sp.]|nr:hypothetical protein [Candidatus Lumbricidophila sp.]